MCGCPLARENLWTDAFRDSVRGARLLVVLVIFVVTIVAVLVAVVAAVTMVALVAKAAVLAPPALAVPFF